MNLQISLCTHLLIIKIKAKHEICAGLYKLNKY